MSLDDLGLIPALERYISIFQEDTGIKVNLRTYGLINNIQSMIQIALFRITQEALSNIENIQGNYSYYYHRKILKESIWWFLMMELALT